MSAVYTTDHSQSVLKTHSWRTLSNSAPYLLPHIQPNQQVLDVGCGPGSITVDIAQKVTSGHVTGLDYVSSPLEAARQLADSQGVSNISFQVGDIHALPFADNTFDIVHAHQVLQHIQKPVQALREMRRVVKPGGIVAVRESAALHWYPEFDGIAAWQHLAERMQRKRGTNPHPGSMIHVWANEAGFVRENIKKSAGSWCFSSPEERSYWGNSMEERARSSGFANVAIAEGFATQDDLETIAKGWRAFVESEDAWFGILHGEILCWR